MGLVQPFHQMEHTFDGSEVHVLLRIIGCFHNACAVTLIVMQMSLPYSRLLAFAPTTCECTLPFTSAADHTQEKGLAILQGGGGGGGILVGGVGGGGGGEEFTSHEQGSVHLGE